MKFEWDIRKAAINEQKHGVSFVEACTVFNDEFASTVRDPDHSEEEVRYLTFGVSASGRSVVVSHTDRGDAIRIISARTMTPGERKASEEP